MAINRRIIIFTILILVTNSLSVLKTYKAAHEKTHPNIHNQQQKQTYKPIKPIELPQQLLYDSQQPILGGWNSINVTNLTQTQKKVDKTIRSRFSELANAKLVSGKSQQVNGWNYQFIYQDNITSNNGQDSKNTTWTIKTYVSNKSNSQPSVKNFSRKTVQQATVTKQKSSTTQVNFAGQNLTAQDIKSEKESPKKDKYDSQTEQFLNSLLSLLFSSGSGEFH